MSFCKEVAEPTADQCGKFCVPFRWTSMPRDLRRGDSLEVEKCVFFQAGKTKSFMSSSTASQSTKVRPSPFVRSLLALGSGFYIVDALVFADKINSQAQRKEDDVYFFNDSREKAMNEAKACRLAAAIVAFSAVSMLYPTTVLTRSFLYPLSDPGTLAIMMGAAGTSSSVCKRLNELEERISATRSMS